jgi:hypothetical protein
MYSYTSRPTVAVHISGSVDKSDSCVTVDLHHLQQRIFRYYEILIMVWHGMIGMLIDN